MKIVQELGLLFLMHVIKCLCYYGGDLRTKTLDKRKGSEFGVTAVKFGGSGEKFLCNR